MTASALLSLAPHPGQMRHASLDMILAADPGKGLVGYEKGQLVFPGVPSDIAMPAESEPPRSSAPETNGEFGAIHISLPGVDYGTADQTGAGATSAENGLDLDSLGIAELSALINGDMAENPGVGSGMMGNASVFTPETSAMLDQLAPGLTQSAVQSLPTGQGVPQALLASLDQADNTIQHEPPSTVENPNQSLGTLEEVLIPQVTAANPQPANFDFSTLDGADNLDSLADIDFNELAGMFGGSGRTTRAASPIAGIGALVGGGTADIDQAEPMQIQAVTQNQPDSIGLGLGDMYPTGGSGAGHAAAFDGTLGGINLDDFDFGGDGEGSMPVVGGEEFESMWAEFK
jgi:hypothetical protein